MKSPPPTYLPPLFPMIRFPLSTQRRTRRRRLLVQSPPSFIWYSNSAHIEYFMGYRRTPFALHEWYHCYNRGVEKRVTFEYGHDFQRFEQLLFLANDTKPVDRNQFSKATHEQVLCRSRSSPIVAIGAYCLMPNHFHLLLREVTEGGISKFMHKIGTGYTMYFNVKNNRIGNLFVKPFRSKHIDNDSYLRRVAQYIHLNATELYEPGWKHAKVKNIKCLKSQIINYTHSSLPDYHHGIRRTAYAILDPEAFQTISAGLPSLQNTLKDAQAYYALIK